MELYALLPLLAGSGHSLAKPGKVVVLETANDWQISTSKPTVNFPKADAQRSAWAAAADKRGLPEDVPSIGGIRLTLVQIEQASNGT